MPTYETLFITLPNLSEEEEHAAVATLTQVVLDLGGVMAANERMGRRRLAYPIKKFDDGVYTRFLYDADPNVPRELERRLRISDRVLRHMTVRLEEEWAEAAKIQAVQDAEAREAAEAARAAAEAAGQSVPAPDAGFEAAAARARDPEPVDEEEKIADLGAEDEGEMDDEGRELPGSAQERQEHE